MKLTTKYLGMELANPLVASSSPLTRSLDTLRRIEDGGAAGVVLYSLFEEEIDMNEEAMEYYRTVGSESFAEALSYFPATGRYTEGADHYLAHLRKAKEALRIPVFASLNGISPGGWTSYARQLQEAGADGIELNIYFLAADPDLDAAAIEARYVQIVRSVASEIRIPLAVKLSPYFTSLPSLAKRLIAAGATGLVLFNRFYQPDIDLEALEVSPQLQLSTPYEARLAMRWIAILRSRIEGSLAATGGVHSAIEVLKLLMCGADATMVCSALLEKGPGHLREILAGLARWGDDHGYESVEQMKGSMSYDKAACPTLFERANYMKVLQSVP